MRSSVHEAWSVSTLQQDAYTSELTTSSHSWCAPSVPVHISPSFRTHRMYTVITFSRLGINGVWLPILLAVGCEEKCNFPCPRSRLIVWSREFYSSRVLLSFRPKTKWCQFVYQFRLSTNVDGSHVGDTSATGSTRHLK